MSDEQPQKPEQLAPQQQPTAAAIQLIGADQYSPLHAGVATCAWACQLVLGRNVPDITGQGPALVINERIINLPWPLAKAVRDALSQAIEQQEKLEGEIRLPSSMVLQATQFP